jgi:hypothetical protein
MEERKGMNAEPLAMMVGEVCIALGCSLEELDNWAGWDAPKGAAIRFRPDGIRPITIHGQTVNARVWSADRVAAAKGLVDGWRTEKEGARIDAECARVDAEYKRMHGNDEADRATYIKDELARVDKTFKQQFEGQDAERISQIEAECARANAKYWQLRGNDEAERVKKMEDELARVDTIESDRRKHSETWES